VNRKALRKARANPEAGSRASVPATAFSSRIKRGILWGWSLAGAVTLFVLLRMELARFTLPAADERRFVGVLVAYWGVGTAVGLMAAVVAHSTRGRWRTAALGFLAAIPVYGGAMVAVEGPRELSLDTATGVLLISAVVGPLVALIVRATAGPRSWPFGDQWP
jgi:hypothetical protein